MTWKDIPWNPSPRTLRRFAVLLILFLGWMAYLQVGVRRNKSPELGFLFGSLAFLIGLPGIVRPGYLRPVFVGWMILVYPVAYIFSRLLLALVYYGLFTPLGLVFRLVGRDALKRRLCPASTSYWKTKPMASDDARSYFRQF